MVKIQKNNSSNFDINKFFRDINLKKQYIKKLKNKIILLKNLKEKNYKKLNLAVFHNVSNYSLKENFLINYIVDITFSRTNTLLHVMDFAGNLKFFCSAGSLQYKGKRKKSRSIVIRNIYRVLVSKLKFLKGQPIALHLKNVSFAKFWIIKLLKKKLFIKIVRSFNLYPHNGCRKKKMKRKKFKKK